MPGINLSPGCGCCCRIFDFHIDKIDAFRDGVTYDGVGQFEGTLEPGESITVNKLIDGTANGAIYRVNCDLIQGSVPGGGGAVFEWNGSLTSPSWVDAQVGVSGLTLTGNEDYIVEIDFDFIDHSATEGTLSFPGGQFQTLWLQGNLTGSGPTTFNSGRWTPLGNWHTNGIYTFRVSSGRPESITVTRFRLTFPDIEGSGQTYPIQVSLDARNTGGGGWTRSHLLANGERQICDAVQWNGDVYRNIQYTENRLEMTPDPDPYAERGYAQVNWSEGEERYLHWIGEDYWRKDGDTETLYDTVSLDPPNFLPVTSYAEIPILDVRSLESELLAMTEQERTMEWSPVGYGFDFIAPTLPNAPMEDLAVKVTNHGEGPFDIETLTAYLIEGADPFDDYNCPQGSEQPSYPPINPSCDRFPPVCDGFHDTRQLLWDVDVPRFNPSNPDTGFHPTRYQIKTVCDPGAASWCDERNGETDGEIVAEPTDLRDYKNELTDYYAQEGPEPRRTRYFWNTYPTTESITGSPSQTIHWNLTVEYTLDPATKIATFTPSLQIRYADRTVEGPGAVGTYSIDSGPTPVDLTGRVLDQSNHRYGRDPDAQQCDITGLDRPGIFTYTDGRPYIVGKYNGMLESGILMDPVQVPLCDLVVGKQITFQVPAATPTLTMAGPWRLEAATQQEGAWVEKDQADICFYIGEGGSSLTQTFFPSVLSGESSQIVVDFSLVTVTITLREWVE